jgi:hypothetical protein
MKKLTRSSIMIVAIPAIFLHDLKREIISE